MDNDRAILFPHIRTLYFMFSFHTSQLCIYHSHLHIPPLHCIPNTSLSLSLSDILLKKMQPSTEISQRIARISAHLQPPTLQVFIALPFLSFFSLPFFYFLLTCRNFVIFGFFSLILSWVFIMVFTSMIMIFFCRQLVSSSISFYRKVFRIF